MNTCSECKDKVQELQRDIQKICDDNQIDNVSFIQWKFSDRDQKITSQMTSKDFAEYVATALRQLKFHDYVYKQQAQEIHDLKEKLPLNHIIINMDYAENFCVANQNEPQQGHFMKRQISLYTVYIHMNRTGAVEEKSLVILSDEGHHGTASVYTCYEKLKNWLKEMYPGQIWEHTLLVTDGCAGNMFLYS